MDDQEEAARKLKKKLDKYGCLALPHPTFMEIEAYPTQALQYDYHAFVRDTNLQQRKQILLQNDTLPEESRRCTSNYFYSSLNAPGTDFLLTRFKICSRGRPEPGAQDYVDYLHVRIAIHCYSILISNLFENARIEANEKALKAMEGWPAKQERESQRDYNYEYEKRRQELSRHFNDTSLAFMVCDFLKLDPYMKVKFSHTFNYLEIRVLYLLISDLQAYDVAPRGIKLQILQELQDGRFLRYLLSMQNEDHPGFVRANQIIFENKLRPIQRSQTNIDERERVVSRMPLPNNLDRLYGAFAHISPYHPLPDLPRSPDSGGRKLKLKSRSSMSLMSSKNKNKKSNNKNKNIKKTLRLRIKK
jgi:hypothetical protein